MLAKMPFTKSLKSLSRKMDGRLLTIHTLYRQELSNFTSTWVPKRWWRQKKTDRKSPLKSKALLVHPKSPNFTQLWDNSLVIEQLYNNKKLTAFYTWQYPVMSTIVFSQWGLFSL